MVTWTYRVGRNVFIHAGLITICINMNSIALFSDVYRTLLFQALQVGVLFTFLARQMARQNNTIMVSRALFEQVWQM